eukprot:3506221-Lingulodinium_polyedra.AAC.1
MSQNADSKSNTKNSWPPPSPVPATATSNASQTRSMARGNTTRSARTEDVDTLDCAASSTMRFFT